MLFMKYSFGSNLYFFDEKSWVFSYITGLKGYLVARIYANLYLMDFELLGI